MIDTGRSHQVYGVAYFWVLLMHRLPDGRTITVNLGDGMASGYTGVD